MGRIQDIFTRPTFTRLASAGGVSRLKEGAKDMTWTDLTTNVSTYIGQLKTRFPHVDEAALQQAQDPDTLITHVALRHDLTPFEAHQEIDDWLFVEALARQASDLRAG